MSTIRLGSDDRALTFAVAAVVALAAPILTLVIKGSSESADFARHCREAGGVPVHTIDSKRACLSEPAEDFGYEGER